MRKYMKQKLIQLLESTKNYDQLVGKYFLEGNTSAVSEILAKSQDVAIKIGETIEKTEGDGTKTVGLLEEYCEILWNVSQSQTLDEAKSELNSLNIKRDQIVNSINEDIPVKLEIVFLPYKVAMWDSLESVWRVASEDPTCDAYVVPIPYFDKNADGSLGQMHYEGNDYPKDVPIVDFRAYDIEARRPDIIYIHNPYDNNNAVTSVHPSYYAQRIHQFTEKLVYIPYFVADRGVPEDLRVLPGSVYAHEVIVSTKKEKEDYIEGFEKWIANKTLSGDYELYMPKWREKFKVLGSPKYDKVMRTERRKDALLQEWADKIYREDGSRRKVLFYNTTIKTLLDKDNILVKIKNTIEILKQEPDVVLWWRPHPLYESTLQSSKPELLEEYRRIVAQFKTEGVGIFDDTPDLDRAIAESDAYYGDGSSVVYLFQKVGKPVMIQNVEM